MMAHKIWTFETFSAGLQGTIIICTQTKVLKGDLGLESQVKFPYIDKSHKYHHGFISTALFPRLYFIFFPIHALHSGQFMDHGKPLQDPVRAAGSPLQQSLSLSL